MFQNCTQLLIDTISTNVKGLMLRPKNWKPHKTLVSRPLDLNSDKLWSEFKAKWLKNFGNQVRHIFVWL